jgi:hypothetical protein
MNETRGRGRALNESIERSRLESTSSGGPCSGHLLGHRGKSRSSAAGSVE